MNNPIGSAPKAQVFTHVQDGKEKRVSYSFYRGEHTNFHPDANGFDQPNVVTDYLVKGLMPSEPFVDENTTIVAFGSCFAVNISNYLNKMGYNVATKRDQTAYVSKMGDGMVNTYAIRQQFEWAWENRVPSVDLWHGYQAAEFGYDPVVQQRTRELFDSAELFVITLGLSEVWYDEPTGEVFWRAIPKDKFDPARHKFRVASQRENLDNLQAIYRLIRARRPEARIVFTVSPIPLAATFRPIACISANSTSKSILRCAIDEFMRSNQPTDPRLFYFPSYEVVLNCFNHQFCPDLRHVYPHVLDFNMKIFERYYCRSKLKDADLLRSFRTARAKDKLIGEKGHEAVALKPTGLTPEQAKAAIRAKRLKERIALRLAESERKKAERKSARRAQRTAAKK